MSDASTREDRIASGCLQLIGFVVVAVFVLLSAWPDNGDDDSASRDGIAWETYDVTIDVREDGSLHVTEAQEVTFDGSYSQGFAEIPMTRIESIDNVSVTLERGVEPDEDGRFVYSADEPEGDLVEAREVRRDPESLRPNTFRAEREGDLFLIDYAFEPTSYAYLAGNDNNTRTIIIEYDAHGVIRDYPDAAEPWQQLHWLAISDEVTAIAPVREASVTVNLPESVAEDDLVVAPGPDSSDGRTITWTRTGMGDGDSFDVQAAFPAITGATAPAWQPAADARDTSLEEQAQRWHAGQLMLILAGIAIVVLGGLTLLYAWYRGIREPRIGPVHQEINDPPGDLPAVLVGSLLDEEVHPRDIAAGVLDLDRQGVITIRNGTETEPERYYLTLNGAVPSRPAWAREIIRGVFGENGKDGDTKGFSALADLFGPRRRDLQLAIDQTLVDDGYYEELPETSRKHWTWVTYGFAAAGVIAAIAILLWVRDWTPWAVAPLVPGFALSWYGRRLTPHIAQKTLKGAETASLWRAFQQHLVSTGTWTSGETRARRQAEYGPWLLAFGMEQGWLSEMNRPSWETPQRRAGSFPTQGTFRGEVRESRAWTSTMTPRPSGGGPVPGVRSCSRRRGGRAAPGGTREAGGTCNRPAPASASASRRCPMARFPCSVTCSNRSVRHREAGVRLAAVRRSADRPHARAGDAAGAPAAAGVAVSDKVRNGVRAVRIRSTQDREKESR